jgi:hypothetical protein
MPPPVGLLLVHGIGMQEPGDTLEGFLGGMRIAYGERLRVTRREQGYAVLEGVGRTVHVIEVYWADLLQGAPVKGTFDHRRLREWAWFPLLYAQADSTRTRRADRLRAAADSFGLAIVAAAFSAGLFGARILASAVQGGVEAVRESARGRPRPTVRERTALDRVLDEIVGDVFNYVHGVTGAFPTDDDKDADEQATVNAGIVSRVAAIQPRFTTAVGRVRDAGCSELQVLAHSLGTVVAFRGLCLRERAPMPGAGHVLRLTRFHTFGSPIEKFRRFWWRVVDGSALGPGIAEGSTMLAEASSGMRWDNFYSPLDLVSGALSPCSGWPEPHNHRAPGLGGLVSAHVAYHGNPRFVAFIGEALTGEHPRIEVPLAARAWGHARALAETLVAPAVLVGVSLLGFVVMVGFAWLVGLAISRPLSWMGLSTLATILHLYMPASILFVMTIGDMIIGRADARALHHRYWTRTP